MKIMNPIYDKINDNPINVWSRTIIGEAIKPEEIKGCSKLVEKMLKNRNKYSKQINELIDKSVYNLGTSSEKGAEYIINSLEKKIKEKKNEK